MQADLSLLINIKQKLFADPRRMTLLKQIDVTGSISQGARQAGMSYKSAWDAINEMNVLSGQVLVTRITGGKGGGGTQITPWGKKVMQLFHLLEQIQQRAFNILSNDSPPPANLLTAVARCSLQTSARNQLFATVLHRQPRSVQECVEVQLADGHSRIQVMLSRQSADRLQLHEGKEVQLLIKAPCVQITKQTTAVNALPVTVSHLTRGPGHSEVILTLKGGETLCATLPNAQLRQLNLKINQRVTAVLNAEHIIIAAIV